MGGGGAQRHQIEITAAILSSISESRARATWSLMRRASATELITPGSAPRLKRAIRSPHTGRLPANPFLKICPHQIETGGWRWWWSAQIHSSTSGQLSRHRRRLEFTSSPYPRVQMSGCHSNLLILLQMSEGEVTLGLEHRQQFQGGLEKSKS